uniref:Putative basic tail protein n=1 Tax=Ixodes ricinus TaxID=34613 RepID=A0A0K8RHH0_IXORI
MLAATFFGMTIACFVGEITCNELKQLGQYIQSCGDNQFHEPGYSRGCTYSCTSGNEGENSVQINDYRNATVCVEFTDNDDTKLDHVGVCFSGVCLGHKERCPDCTESQLEERWSRLPELAGEFHRCRTLNEGAPVGNCLYVCTDTHEVGKEGYFYGIYKDGNPCTVENGKNGVCRSGWCKT